MITLLVAAALSGIPVHVGRFDESEFPNATRVERRMPHAELTHRVDRILASRRCRLPGQTRTHFDISVPYAVLMQPNGQAAKVVVKDIGCAPIETLVGQLATQLASSGDFRPTHQEGERWYVSEANFSRMDHRIATGGMDPDKVICRAAEAKLGSRIATRRVCRTASEWDLYEVDREQFQRDQTQKGYSPAGTN
jgi:hypothetical protein